MSSVRLCIFAAALLLFAACLAVAQADTTVREDDGTSETTHVGNPVKNLDGSTTTTTTITYKDAEGKTYATRTITGTTFPFSTRLAKNVVLFVRPAPGTITLQFANGPKTSVTYGFEEEEHTATLSPDDDSSSSHTTTTTIDPKTGTKTVVQETRNHDSNGKSISGEQHTTTTPTGAAETRVDKVLDPKTNTWVPAVQDASGNWIPAVSQAPPTHHNNTGEVVGGILVLGGLIAVLASHGNTSTTSSSSSGGTMGIIMFAPSSLTGCVGKTASVTVSGGSGPYTLSTNNTTVASPTTTTTTGPFVVQYGSMKGTATITATDTASKTGALGVTVNC